MKPPKALPPEVIERGYIDEKDNPLYVPSLPDIIALLNEGHDSFTICQRLRCSAMDVVNAERRMRHQTRLMRVEPPITDEETVDPSERLYLFPPVD